MDSFLFFVKENPMECLTAILVFLTAIYALLTHRMVKLSEESIRESKLQTEALTRPYITIQPLLKKHTPVVYLSIKNTGLVGAKNLRLELDRDFFQFNESAKPNKNLRTLKAFTLPIQQFSPNSELVFPLAQSFLILGEEASASCPAEFSVTATYEYANKTVTEVSYIDIEAFSGGEVDRDPLVNEVEKIRKIYEKKA
ncbi:hypothetical protein MHM95_04365 [Pseudoalteromonas sp. CnMc7-15]|uniref:hypothetical protein n=1 Tax=unclassified Pseudoalteromonas TaxID=194690 RepID=UPI001EF61CC2|nr:hypothetical protein [Pseudoalteromonas sp. CnMc7-15]MCG7565512.1 hypothetical protein [Pseudoalteromonas sp. CnMc7-15]